MKLILGTVSAIALMGAFSGSVLAADPAPLTSWTEVPLWADVSFGGGGVWLTDGFNNETNNGYFLAGESRFGYKFSPGTLMQFDLRGETQHTIANCGVGCSFNDDSTNYNAAAHLLMTGGANAFGLMLSTGTSEDHAEWVTAAAEGVFTATPSLRFVVQAGYNLELAEAGAVANNAPYIHSEVQYLVNDKLMISGNVGYVRPSSDEGPESVFRYGLKAEYAFSDVASVFTEWQGQNRVEGDDPADNPISNRVMVGFKMRLNDGGSLFNSSPLHDYNWKSGVNNLFEH